ncbi:MAG: TIGR00730 family Rossman fold protein [Alphaproteobacteria bacterium]|nr:TIGR00730 family Rossman fold protein [Alphaproteobacteria bacterium]MCB9975000.1 TIGR00730 family Rossman fold protein [Rhodospirillales bacterium]
MNLSDIQRITVYLGSSGRCDMVYKCTARDIGVAIAQAGKKLVYGGMDSGLMGIVANAALERDGKVVGIIPKNLKDSERIHPDLDETILVPDLWQRKRKMFKRGDVIVALPGGFGTLDETAEALHWAALKLHRKPVVLVNTKGYWDSLIKFFKPLSDFREDYLIVADSVEDIFPLLEKWNPPADSKKDNGEPFPHFEGEILNGSGEPIIFDKATVEQAYVLSTALGLKQLDKHQRPLGILNTNGQFDALLEWVVRAQNERFISDRCMELFSVAPDRPSLEKKLKDQKPVKIDLATEKWGPGVTQEHIELIFCDDHLETETKKSE